METKILESLRLRIKNVSDELITDFITDATSDVKTYTNRESEELPQECSTIIKDLVMIRANKLGSEGISSESFSGVSQTYESDLPPELKRRLNKYRRLP